MADEAVYAAGGETNKRKYEDSPPPVGRRSTGFSSPPDSAAPPPSYNNVPPPLNEIELAKQKVQEIAARLLNNADPSKRARVENGAGAGGGYDAVDTGVCHKHPGLGLGGPAQSAYGHPGLSKKIDIPNGKVGVIIGKGGETIKYLQQQSGAKIQITRDMDADPNSTSRAVELMGTPDQIAKAEQLINDVLSEADAGGSGIVSRRLTGPQSGAERFVMMIANNKVGLVIGKGGETIKSMQATTGARIQVIPLHLPPGDMSKERTVQIDGTSEQIEAAKQMVEEVTSENRMRGQSMSGGYSQQGYQARPPTNWAQPGPPTQQPGYGYVQPGAYPGPPQYGMTQPAYSGYPPQPASGGYRAGWDQSSTAAQNQGGYDYYNQQQQAPPAAPTDASGYSYSQAAYSQGQGGYGQDGYGGYHAQSGYGQQQQNPSAGYDQQQQGYNSAYPAPDGQTPAYGSQGDPNQAHASAQSYSQAPSQPGYEAQGGYGTQPPYGNYATPQSQKPGSQPAAAYAQPQQSPSAQGGAYTQPGYPHSQPPPAQASYAHADSGAQRPPSSGYPAAAAAAAAAQPGYSQQQPPQYSGGAYGATSPQAAAQSTGAAKASPPS
ncbi:far upstream element-binding protein 2-like [Salvia splendens]|uniref:far upstream element-binding protein 2-like n=1 Tax=Salvia splendens TaxID=180675 RepID=UPI001C26D51F|nr:far upstream element-binding protein 2-like [Salvia splendens]